MFSAWPVVSSDSMRTLCFQPALLYLVTAFMRPLGFQPALLYGVIQVLRNARGGGWVYAQALRSVTWGGGVTSALRNVFFVANTVCFTVVMSSRPTRISK